MKYKAFISYSHAADGLLAPAIQKGLHRLAKPWYRLRALNIFRDETGLTVNPALWTSIKAALDESEYFILLASPEAANSHWVKKELEYWLVAKQTQNIQIVLTNGDLVWDNGINNFDFHQSTSIPPILSNKFDELPNYGDLRWVESKTQLDLRNSQFRGEIAKIAAPLHGKGKEELESEDIRQQKRTIRLAWTFIISLLFLLISAISLGILWYGQLQIAQDNEQALGTQKSIAEDVANSRATLQVEAESAGATAITESNIRATAEVQAITEANNRATAEAIAIDERDEAQRQSRIRYSDQLAAVSRNLAADQPQLSTLLAVEAANVTIEQGEKITQGAWQALIDSLSNIDGWGFDSGIGGYQYGGTIIKNLIISPDGNWLAVIRTDSMMTREEWITRVYYIGDGIFSKVIIDLPTNQEFNFISFSKNNRNLITANNDSIQVWEITDQFNIEFHSKIQVNGISSISISNDKDWIVVVEESGTILLIDIENFNYEPIEFFVDGMKFTHAEISPSGDYLATGNNDFKLHLWKLANGVVDKSKMKLIQDGINISCLQFSQDSSMLVGCDARGWINLWDTSNYRTRPRLLNHGYSNIDRVKVSNNNEWLIVSRTLCKRHLTKK